LGPASQSSAGGSQWKSPQTAGDTETVGVTVLEGLGVRAGVRVWVGVWVVDGVFEMVGVLVGLIVGVTEDVMETVGVGVIEGV